MKLFKNLSDIYGAQKRRLFNRRPGIKRLKVPDSFQPPSHTYAGYRGPWIENYFFEYWCRHEKEIINDAKVQHIYIPIFWTDYYVKHGLHKPHHEIQEYLDSKLEQDKKYFTIVQNADGILEKLPENVLLFSCGGKGGVPIPLLKQPLTQGNKKRDILCSFMGAIEGAPNRTGLRQKMYEALKKDKRVHFVVQEGKPGRDGNQTKPFRDLLQRSAFTLCPRGYGQTSFRLYEAMSAGSIPIYIWDEVEWLPYKPLLSWDNFSISIHIDYIDTLPEILSAYTTEMIKGKQKTLAAKYNEYFSYDGVCGKIIKNLSGEIGNSGERFELLKQLILKHRFELGAEIGTAEATTAEYLLSNIKDLKLYSIDFYMPYEDSYWGKVSPMIQGEIEFDSRLKKYIASNRCVRIKKSSNEAVGNMKNEYFDFIFIDGDHSYPAVSDNLINWWPKLKANGIMCGDDYHEKCFPGVVKAVKEFAHAHHLTLSLSGNTFWMFSKKNH